MDLEPLPSIILALAEQRSLYEVLRMITDTVARQPGVALARVWLREPEGRCPICEPLDGSTDEALHLRASAGTSQSGEDWSRIDGSFHRIEIANSTLKIAYIASTGQSLLIPDVRRDHDWLRYPEWAQQEGLIGFAGHSLLFRERSLGTLAVFRRMELDDLCFEWLKTMARAAAIAIANARAFEDNEALRNQLEQERDYLMEEVGDVGAFGEILGRSRPLDRVLQQVRMVAQTDANVLILGESGTGKELVARAIHQRSARAHKPMVRVNCGSIARELFESEFFGHVRGSFTGALRDRVGRFQLADGGTLFLDEVGEIPIELQPKLLRVLQEGEFERVGDDISRRVDVRVIAATNRNVLQQIEQGLFRLDLYYRLCIFPLEVPPLRERKDDIPELIRHFVQLACKRFHLPQPALPAREIDRAKLHNWPGNVRELQNVVERAVIISNGGKVSFDLPNNPVRTPPSKTAQTNLETFPSVIAETQWREMERSNLIAALRLTKCKLSGKDGAAELLGLNPGTLASRLRALGIHKQDVCPPEKR